MLLDYGLLNAVLTFAIQAVFHDYIVRIKGVVFNGAAEVIMTRLSKAAEAVGDALKTSLNELARKVCIPNRSSCLYADILTQ